VKKSPAYIAAHIRSLLQKGGSAPHSVQVQRFFKHQIKSRGWSTHALRQLARRFRREILAEQDLASLVQVADRLFAGAVLEEKNFAVMLLEGITGQLGPREFKLLEGWLDRVTSWADHDGLVHYLIGPMVAADDVYLKRLPTWAGKKSRWHQRAAAVSLVQSTRRHKNFNHIQRVTELLANRKDDMVQKGLGWLLREAVKANPRQAVTYLMSIRQRLPRPVLRRACETLAPGERRRVLEKANTARSPRSKPITARPQ
jgi:3-methyladenine DNA glycosylase AlkD